MAKKQATILTAIETTAVPADVDFVVDGRFANINLHVFLLTGTAPTIETTVTELFEAGFTFDYDAQTANFTVGAELRGKDSGATAIIMKDTDGGATGTLELKKVVGYFKDNEQIVDDNGTPGVAVANGVPVRVFDEGHVWATIGATNSDDDAVFINPDTGLAGAGDLSVEVIPRRFRLKISKGATTWTAAHFSIDLCQSEF